MNARLEKKRKQLERNKKKMAFRRDVLQAETESCEFHLSFLCMFLILSATLLIY